MTSEINPIEDQLSLNICFDVYIARLIFNKKTGRENWNSLIESMLQFEPNFENQNLRICTSANLFLETIGVKLKQINTELKESIINHKAYLKPFSSKKDTPTKKVDNLFEFSEWFYSNHPYLTFDSINQKHETQFDDYSLIHENAEPLHADLCKNYLSTYLQPEGLKSLHEELAIGAIGRFGDLIEYKEASSTTAQSRDEDDFSMIKLCKELAKLGLNVSFYRFTERLFKRLNSKNGNLSDLDDGGDCDIINFCTFGSFIFDETQGEFKLSSVDVFIRKEEEEIVIKRVKQQKEILKLLDQQLKELDLTASPGRIFIVDPLDCRVIKYLNVSAL